MKNGADVEKKTKARYTPLILAAARGALEISKILLMNQVVTDETFLNLETNFQQKHLVFIHFRRCNLRTKPMKVTLH